MATRWYRPSPQERLATAKAVTGASSSSPAGIVVPAGFAGVFKSKAQAKLKAKVAVQGDSIAHLYNASLVSKSWVGLLRTALQAKYGDGGSGFTSGQLCARFAPAGTGYTAANFDVVFTGTWTRLAIMDGPGCWNAYSSVPGDVATFSKQRGTTVKTYVMGNAAAQPYAVSIDGGAYVNQVTGGLFAMSVYTVSGLAPGEHTVRIKVGAVTGANAIFVYGVAAENDTGVVVDNYASPAATSAHYAGGGDIANPPALWSGGPSRPCDVLLYANGVNDAQGVQYGATTADAYLDNVDATFARVRGTLTAVPDFAVFLPPLGGWQGSGPKWHAMLARLQSYCVAEGHAFANAGAALDNSTDVARAASYFGSTTVPGVPGNETIHASDIGHQFLYSVAAALLN